MPQTFVYTRNWKRNQEPVAHWLRSDGKTFCGRNLRASIDWEQYHGSQFRMCGKCMRWARSNKAAADSARRRA